MLDVFGFVTFSLQDIIVFYILGVSLVFILKGFSWLNKHVLFLLNNISFYLMRILSKRKKKKNTKTLF